MEDDRLNNKTNVDVPLYMSAKDDNDSAWNSPVNSNHGIDWTDYLC